MSRPQTIEYVVRSDHTVVEIRGGWNEFARENQAPELVARSVTGRKLDEFVADAETRMVYEALVDRVLQTGEPIRFRYRCDGPDCRRFMDMEMDVLAPGLVRFRSAMVRREERPFQPLLDAGAERSDATILMCGWCKRVHMDEQWMEVEDFVEETDILSRSALPRISHGICPGCEDDLDRLVA